jgi:hypothetical protein
MQPALKKTNAAFDENGNASMKKHLTRLHWRWWH